MIKVLENFVGDIERRKFVVFPTQSVADNFYKEISRLPSMFREWITKSVKLSPRHPGFTQAVMAGLQKEFKIYSFSYARAGGNTFLSTHKNYDNCVFLMDECHNLVSPTPDMKRYAKQLKNLKNGLKKAEGSFIAGFTATPFTKDPREGEELLSIIKQNEKLNDEGFICFYNHMPLSLYPSTQMKVLWVTWQVGRNKQEKQQKEKYEEKLRHLGKECDAEGDAKLPDKCLPLQNYANTSIFYTQASRHNLENFRKLDAILEVLQKLKLKTLILVERAAGFKIAVRYLQKKHKNFEALYENPSRSEKSKKTLELFNSPENLKGDKLMCVIADAKEFSEGTSFLAVRLLFLLNPPFSYGRYLQQIGRALRSCAFHPLDAKARNVSIYVLATKNSVDSRAVRVLRREQTEYEKSMNRFAKVAVDKKILERFF